VICQSKQGWNASQAHSQTLDSVDQGHGVAKNLLFAKASPLAESGESCGGEGIHMIVMIAEDPLGTWNATFPET
jgi:hypothetical protein